MNSYAVLYTYAPETADARAAALADHKAFLTSAKERGVLLESGALDRGAGALIVIAAETHDEVERIMADEPFFVAGIPSSRTIQLWTANWGAIAAARDA
jgi:uncharacterized protein YciI